ncbi:MAG: hypothetical protein LQ340_000645 [Diploschistes diacapsis]|nr:MAG: hypothetical protein LQ340_000645 [Diploschistes diacapsis]
MARSPSEAQQRPRNQEQPARSTPMTRALRPQGYVVKPDYNVPARRRKSLTKPTCCSGSGTSGRKTRAARATEKMADARAKMRDRLGRLRKKLAAMEMEAEEEIGKEGGPGSKKGREVVREFEGERRGVEEHLRKEEKMGDGRDEIIVLITNTQEKCAAEMLFQGWMR